MTRRRRHILVLTTFLVLLAVLMFEFPVAKVQGSSMLPAFHDGQLVLVARLGARRWTRGDVVLVRVGEDRLIKRIGALPGDTLTFAEARRFRHDARELFEPTGDPRTPLRVPARYVVILGDNAAVSDDSRSFGPVPERDIIGRVLAAPEKQ